MKEDFLHYLWQFQKWNVLPLKTVHQQEIYVHKPGQYLQQAGPDFFNAHIEIDQQLWAGSVEIHLKSSDWYVHHHEKDANYDNVILHVVWEHDMEIYRRDGSIIPTLVFADFVSQDLILEYEQFMQPKSWIYCEKQIKNVPFFQLQAWLERLFFERLERKSHEIGILLEHQTFDWEAVLFKMLTKNFGLNHNGAAFFEMAQNIPFGIVRKEAHNLLSLEALFLGAAGLLSVESEDVYFLNLKEQWQYLQEKYQFCHKVVIKPTFYKLRPDNFPTLRLAQLAQLYHLHHQLFSLLIESNSYEGIQNVFKLKASEYWETHYNFTHQSPQKSKNITRSFVDLVVINTLVPVKFMYAQNQGNDATEALLEIMTSLPAERNAILDKFALFGVSAANAMESQALIELKSQYCEFRKCMQCAVGTYCLKN